MTFDFTFAEDPDFQRILRTYQHLTNDELEQEIKDRTSRRYSTRMVGAAGCMTDAYVLNACSKILNERGV